MSSSVKRNQAEKEAGYHQGESRKNVANGKEVSLAEALEILKETGHSTDEALAVLRSLKK